MKAFEAIKITTGHLGHLLLLALCLILSGATASQAQAQKSSPGERVLQPPKSGLLPVHRPDLESLETSVREQLEEIETSLAALVKDSSTDEKRLGESYGLLGKIYQAYALTTPAEECYLNAHRLAPKDFRWAYLLGSVCQKEGRVEEAITWYRIVRILRPDYLAAPVNLGNLYLGQHRLEEARANFKEALSINAKCPAAEYGLGQAALSTRNYAEAVTHFEQALAQTPEANRIHYALAMAYRGLGDMEKAQRNLEQQGQVGIRVADPLVDDLQKLIRGERVHLLRGRVAFEARRFEDAVEEFRKAVEAQPESIPARVNLGSALAQSGDINEAIKQFEQAISLEPKNSAAHYNLGFLLAKLNRHEQAISHLHSTLDLNPEDADARYLLGQELLRVGNKDGALAEFARLTQSNPGNEAALIEQVNLLMGKKRYAEALENLERSHKQFPQNGQTAAMLAYLLAANPQQDLRDGARALALAQLIYKATGSINHGAVLALALAELGRCDEAARLQQRLIEAAEPEGNSDLVVKLKAGLELYLKGQPCRPVGEAGLSDPAPPDKKRQR